MRVDNILYLLLHHPLSALVGRVLLTMPFWANGLSRIVNFHVGAAEMEQFGLTPGTLFNLLVIVSNLLGAGLVIARRWTWLGAGVLALFTLGTIVIVHRFWAFDGMAATRALHVAQEHVGIIGGLLLAAILAARPQGERP
ncbi:DoxX family protein [Pseudomonas aeruginosa]